jgi:hypothetical protein
MKYSSRATCSAIAMCLFSAACGKPMAPVDAGMPSFEPTGEDPRASDLKGAVSLNQMLRSRLIQEPDDFDFATYLGTSGTSLVELTGVWDGVGVKNSFRSGQPNALNFLILKLAFHGLGRDIAALCPGVDAPRVRGLKLTAEISQKLPTLCKWPAEDARSRETLMAVWVALAGYDAPEAEFEAWLLHFQSDVYRGATAAQVIPKMVRSALLNPYVLLQP